MNEKWQPFRADAIDKVTGQARYCSDIDMDRMVYLKVLRTPVPHALIKDIKTDNAAKAKGVVRVFTRKDIEGPNMSGRIGAHMFDQPILVGINEEARNAADAVAMIAAESDDEAERALELIEIEYEELSTVNTAEEAIAAKAAPVCTKEMIKGNVDEGFSKAAVIIEDTYYTPYAEHAYMEPECGYAYVGPNGIIQLCVPTQDLRQQHSMVCKALGIPYNKVHMFTPYVGGGFGGKHSLSVHIFLALAAMLLDRPVKMTWTREESVCFSCKKQSFSMKVKLGVDKEGHIVAYQGDIVGPTSPYTGKSLGRLAGYMNHLTGPYRHENIQIKGAMYATTALEIGAFRGVAGPDGAYVIETLLDRAAKELDISPLEIRKRNWIQKNEDLRTQFPGIMAHNYCDRFGVEETTKTVLEKAGELKTVPNKITGRGIACAMPGYAVGYSDTQNGTVVSLTMQLDGSLTVAVGYPELGQGITGVLTSIVEKEFGVTTDQVGIVLSDMEKTPVCGGIGWSIATVTAGAALVNACDNLKKRLVEVAAEILKADTSDIIFDKGAFYNKNGDEILTWDQFENYCYVRTVNLTVFGEVEQSLEQRNQYAVAPVSCLADVAVDPDTGDVEILQIIQSHDTGKVIHYDSARGQLLGSAVMAIGTTMMEEFIAKDGKAVTRSLSTYLVPTSMDVPKRNEAFFVESNPAAVGPYGGKGLGEHGMYTVGPAIANAIFDAIGIYVTDLPITSEKIVRALNKI